MATNSSKYQEQVDNLDADLATWSNYITTNAAVILQFTDTINTLQNQIDDLNKMINGLELRSSLLEDHVAGLTPYVKTSANYINVTTGLQNICYADPDMEAKHKSYINSFSKIPGGDNGKVYVYATHTIPNLYMDDYYNVTSYNDCVDASYFYSFDGVESGMKHLLYAGAVKKISGAKLLFSQRDTYSEAIKTTNSSISAWVEIRMVSDTPTKQQIVVPGSLRGSTTGKAISSINSGLDLTSTPNTEITITKKS